MARLIVKKKAEILAEYRIGKKTIINIGSARGNDVVVTDKNVSENHCVITLKEGRYEIKDKNTITGTRVNDRSVTTDRELQFEDLIGIGAHTIVLCDDTRRMRAGKKEGALSDDSALCDDNGRFYLVGIYGKFEGKKYEVKQGETYVGRENVSPKGIANDIVLSGDMTVSKGHARISCAGTQCVLTDVGSTGGVAVNGAKVGQLNDVSIVPGDEIAIGRTIFRFIDAMNEDFGVPKRQDILLLKIRQPVSLFLTVLVLGTGLWYITQGARGMATLSSKPKKVEVDINRYWSPEENSVRSSAGDYDITSSPAIGDINNDGINEVVYLNSSGQLCAWNGKKGALIWKPVEVYNSGKSSPALFDMNNDGILDIIVTSDTSMLYIIDGMTGGIIRREMLGGAIAELSPAVHDLNGDGKPDVIACSEEGMVHFIYAPGYENSVEKYTEFIEGPIYASPVIVATKKISPMVVVCSNNSKVFFFDGANRSKKTVDLVEKTQKPHLIAAPPAVGDINGDGIPEVVVQSNVPQYVSAIDITKFDVMWTYFVEPVPPAGLKHTSSPVIADFNGDGAGDVLAVSANGKVYCLKGNTGYPAGELISKLDIQGANRMIAAPALADFDKNGMDDAVVGAEDGSVYILKSMPKRKELEVMSMIRASNAPITSGAAIGDINGDKTMEVVYTNVLNTVQILNTNVRTFKNKVDWGMYLANAMRSSGIIEKATFLPFAVRAGSGLLICVLLLIFKLWRNLKKLNKRPKVVYL